MSKPQDNLQNIDPEIEYEEDIYLQELHKRLITMKTDRKKAETQADLLSKRLKVLQGEELKNLKKIEVVRCKTQNRITQLERVELSIQMKTDNKEKKENEIKEQKEKNLEFKKGINEKIEEKRMMKNKEIFDEANKLREQRKNNEELMKYIKLEEHNTNKNKYEFIKAQQLLAEERKKANEIERKNKLKLELELKLLEEEKMKEEAEKVINKLEEEEAETMNRIKTTTQVHKNMQEELAQLSLGSGAKGKNRKGST